MKHRDRLIICIVITALFTPGCTTWWKNFYFWVTSTPKVAFDAKINPGRSDKIAVVRFDNASGMIDAYRICDLVPSTASQQIKNRTNLNAQYYPKIPGHNLMKGEFDPVRIKNFTKARYLVSGKLIRYSDNLEKNPLYKSVYIELVIGVWDLKENRKIYEHGAARKFPDKRQAYRDELIQRDPTTFMKTAISLLGGDISKIFYDHEEWIEDIKSYDF